MRLSLVNFWLNWYAKNLQMEALFALHFSKTLVLLNVFLVMGDSVQISRRQYFELK